MDLKERYIYAVVKRLPQSQREDIEKELQGLIEDMLAEKCSDKVPGKAALESVLNELGDPSQLADKYRETKRYLIGPEHFDIYLLVLKIAIGAAVFGVTLATAISMLVTTPANLAEGFMKVLGNIINTGFSAFAWVTIIFALNEQFNWSKDAKPMKKSWSLNDLPPVPAKEAVIRKSEPITAIIFAVLFITLFNFSSQLMGIYIFDNGKLSEVIPIFSETGISRLLPLITVMFCISIIKECVKLIIGKWTLQLAVINSVLTIIAFIFCIIVFSNGAIWNNNFVSQVYTTNIASAGIDIELVWSQFTKGFIYIVLLIGLIDTAASAYKGFKYKLNS